MSEFYNSLPPAARKIVYLVYAVVGVIIGSIQIGYATAEAASPPWLSITINVYAFLGAAIGVTAFSNTPKIAQPGGAVSDSVYAAVAGRAISAEEEATIQDPSIDPGEEYRAKHTQSEDDVTGDWSQNGDPNTTPATGADYEVIATEQPDTVDGPTIEDVEDTDELEADYPDLAKLAQAK